MFFNLFLKGWANQSPDDRKRDLQRKLAGFSQDQIDTVARALPPVASAAFRDLLKAVREWQ